MVCPNGYCIVRQDRAAGRGGGVLMLYKNNLQIVQYKPVTTNECFEYICVDVHTGKSITRFCCLYVPPMTANSITELYNVCNCLNICISVKHCAYIMGDFNLPHIDWSIPSSIGNSSHDYFVDFCNTAHLIQHVLQPTHLCGSTLDLLFCTLQGSCNMESLEICPPFSDTCDHSSVSVTIACHTSSRVSSPNILSPDFKRADYTKINEELQQVAWQNIIISCGDNVQLLYDSLCQQLQLLINQHVPPISFTNKPNKPTYIRKLLKEKKKLYQLCKSDSKVKPEYQKISKNYDKAVLQWYESYENSLSENRNPSKFYIYAKNKLKLKPEIPPLRKHNNQLAITDIEKADALNSTFHSVYKTDDGNDLNLPCKILPQQYMKNVTVDFSDVSKAIQMIPDKLSQSPDGIPAYFLKRVAHSILDILLCLFNLSLILSVIPSQWSSAIIVPIHKKGSRDLPCNYRPISLTCVLCRVLEYIIAEKLRYHLHSYNLLSSNQFGFLPSRSTCSQLLTVLNNWFCNYDSNIITHVVYTDIAKAFDSVSHSKLVSVLRSYGVQCNVLEWIKSFLSNRVQKVCINGSFSATLPVISGVPQGSVLGPLLFIVYIDDIVNLVCSCTSTDASSVFLYADDAKLFNCNASQLQHDLDNLASWLFRRQLFLSPPKCQHLAITKKLSNVPSKFFIGIKHVSQADTVIDLGVNISYNLKWYHHICRVQHIASLCAYRVLHCFSSKNVWTLLRAYFTYIRPKLEYNTPVWSPYLKKDIITIESVQRHFTRQICIRCNISFCSYKDRLEKFNIKSLEYRRHEYDLILMYKICHNLSDLNFHNFFSYRKSAYNLRQHSWTIQSYSDPKHNQFQNFFTNRIPKIWNKLPEDIVSAPSLSSFKSRIKKFDLYSIASMVY